MSRIVTGGLVLAASLVLAGASWAGWQRDAVCQGSCGGACGPCGSSNQRSDREDRAESAYDRKVDQYNELQHEAHLAAKAGNLPEAIRLAREALAVLDDTGLRETIEIWRSRILTDEANRTTDPEQKIDLVRRALAIHEFQEGRDWLNKAEAGLEGQKLYDRGWAAFNSGDFALAERLFTQAQEKDPNPAYAADVRLAAAKVKSKQGLSGITETINHKEAAATTVTSDLDFLPADSAVAGTESTTGAFGATSTPANPRLIQPAAKPAVTVDSNLQLLSSIAKSGQDAKKSTVREEKKDLSNCGFDGAPCRDPDPIAFPTQLGVTPGAAELSTHIPEAAKNDEAIRNSVAWFEKLEMHQAETQTKLDELRKEMESGTGDQTALKAKAATLDNELKQNGADQATAKDQIKKRLVDLSLEWNESPEQKD